MATRTSTAGDPAHDDDVFVLRRGTTPLLVSTPHAGTLIPASLQPKFVPRALAVEDTDWHLDRVWAFAADLGASLLVPRCSRYVIDLNRPPDDTPMYPGANNTELCPTRFFTGDGLYRDGLSPDATQVAERRARWWLPYHDALAAELARLKEAHGHAVLFDAHSIRSELPWLFEGRLWDLNLGTVDGTSCAPPLRQALAAVLADHPRYSHVVDGRFKGGYITRRYGRPSDGVHAVQLEMCWHCYTDEAAPHVWNPTRVNAVRPLLQRLVDQMITWRP